MEDCGSGLLLLDGTWRYAEKMVERLSHLPNAQRRSLPSWLVTAYPRRQEGCVDPHRGLASIEALYAAYHLLGRSVVGLLDHYYWRDQFLLQFH